MDFGELQIKKEKGTKGTGVFVIEPLPLGYGVTLGTALRRVLLSSLPGGAIAEIRLPGVSHPFTTIKGVKEDLVDIMLNLKMVRFQLRGDGPFEGTLEAKGKKDLKAGDIKISSEAVVVNPDLKIATLTDKSSKLSVSLIVERGVGYKSADERESGKIGVLPMDSFFSPVTNVSFSVEEARVGRRTDLDKLIVNITTDGTIKPSEALEETAKILHGYFSRIGGLDTAVKKEKTSKAKELEPSVEEASEEVRKIPVSDLGVSPRTLNTLESASIKSVGGLLHKSEEDLLDIKGFGEAGLNEIKTALKKSGVALKE